MLAIFGVSGRDEGRSFCGGGGGEKGVQAKHTQLFLLIQSIQVAACIKRTSNKPIFRHK